MCSRVVAKFDEVIGLERYGTLGAGYCLLLDYYYKLILKDSIDILLTSLLIVNLDDLFIPSFDSYVNSILSRELDYKSKLNFYPIRLMLLRNRLVEWIS